MEDQVDDLVLDDALEVTRAALGWKLSPRRWSDVEQAITTMITMIGDGSSSRRDLNRAVGKLELLAPPRAISASTLAETIPPPAPIRERIVQLVDTLDARRAPSSTTTDRPGASDRAR